jgi:hypothetical protein
LLQVSCESASMTREQMAGPTKIFIGAGKKLFVPIVPGCLLEGGGRFRIKACPVPDTGSGMTIR